MLSLLFIITVNKTGFNLMKQKWKRHGKLNIIPILQDETKKNQFMFYKHPLLMNWNESANNVFTSLTFFLKFNDVFGIIDFILACGIFFVCLQLDVAV